MEKFFQTLAALLPTGFAWPRDAGSTLMRVIRALAASFNEHHDVTTEAVRQWQPATTVNRLAEWEEATGLPDACFAPPLELLQPGRYAVDAARIASSTRATPATYLDATGALLTAAANVPRFDYSFGVPELLVEAGGTNLQLYSEDFNNAAWLKTGAGTGLAPVVTINDGLAPDGTLTAAKIVFDQGVGVTAGDQSFLQGSAATVAGQPYCQFWWLRTTDGSTVTMRADYGGVSSSVGSNLLTVTPVWTRFLVPAINSATNAAFKQVLRLRGGQGTSNFASLHVLSAQFENALVHSSYIRTTAAAVTRSADQIYLFPTEAATRALRRQLLLGRLRGPVLAYDNASPASPAAIVAICAALGYVATVVYNTPFRCGVNRVGDRLGALDGKLYVTVTLQSKAFRVGVSRVGERLLEGQLNGGELACYLQRVLPARYQLNVIFV